MIGWCADYCRLLGGLLYWNLRKSWYRARRGRSPCPCQTPSDSGRAYETQCEAALGWRQPARFRRVCPLLVDTRTGLRCSVDASNVRPFWGRAARHFGLLLLAFYAAAVIAVFTVLRLIGYPVSIVHVGLPPLWHRVVETRSWFFFEKANRAFAQNRVQEGLLYLANAYEFDPANYTAGLSLAKHLQAGQPAHSDAIFQRLLREHPDQRTATSQEWFRALLARGSFERIVLLAREELLRDAPHAAVWLRALVFAARRLGSDQVLRELVATSRPGGHLSRPIFEIELLLRQGRAQEARTLIASLAHDRPAGFLLYYLVSVLAEQRETLAALDLLGRFPDRLDHEASLTLRLDALAAGGQSRLLLAEIDRLLAPAFNPASLPLVKILCAHLIRFPNREIFDRLIRKVASQNLPLNTESAGIWFSLFCAAGTVGDVLRLQEIAHILKGSASRPFLALSAIEAFFRGDTVERRITEFLPALPLPLEVNYALLERFAPPATPAAPSSRP